MSDPTGPAQILRTLAKLVGHVDYVITPDEATALLVGADAIARAESLAATVQALEQERDEATLRASKLLAVLRDMEWLGLNDGRGVTHRQCPACSALQSRGTGHNPYCGLAAAIAKEIT